MTTAATAEGFTQGRKRGARFFAPRSLGQSKKLAM
jgi:hypothetical protein